MNEGPRLRPLRLAKAIDIQRYTRGWFARATATALLKAQDEAFAAAAAAEEAQRREAEERHATQVASLLHALRRSKKKLAYACDQLRGRHHQRLCLHALRAYAVRRDGKLGVVSRDLSRYAAAANIAQTMQAALDQALNKPNQVAAEQNRARNTTRLSAERRF